MRYLLDTNAISELRKRHKHPGVHAFAQNAPSGALHLSTLSIGELQRGILLKRSSDAEGATILQQWANTLEVRFAGRILPVSAAVAKLWGEWSAQRSRPVIDTLIAATAAANNIILVTRNVRDVQDLPVQIVNPWQT